MNDISHPFNHSICDVIKQNNPNIQSLYTLKMTHDINGNINANDDIIIPNQNLDLLDLNISLILLNLFSILSQLI
jgi:hypothetical protein